MHVCSDSIARTERFSASVSFGSLTTVTWHFIWRRAAFPAVVRVLNGVRGKPVRTEAMAINVANQADWNTAVARLRRRCQSSHHQHHSGFTLSSSLAQLQAANANVVVNITAQPDHQRRIVLPGHRGQRANAPTSTFRASRSPNRSAGRHGQNGQNGYYSSGLSYGSGGGGGLGAGGGLLSAAAPTSTLAAVTSPATPPPAARRQRAERGGGSVNGGNGGPAAVGRAGWNRRTHRRTRPTGTRGGAGRRRRGGSGTPAARAIRRIIAVARAMQLPAMRRGGDGVTNNNGSQGPAPTAAAAAAAAAAATRTVARSMSPRRHPDHSGFADLRRRGRRGRGRQLRRRRGPSAFNGTAGGTGTAQGAGIFLSGVTANVGRTSFPSRPDCPSRTAGSVPSFAPGGNSRGRNPARRSELSPF